jgi:hypothetical protein
MPAPAQKAGAGFRVTTRKKFQMPDVQYVLQHRCGRVQAEFTSTRRWARALRPEHHPRSDQSGHVEQPACRTRCPKEPHAQRSWHLQRSPPAQSEDLPPEVCLPTLDDERLVEEHARSRGVEEITNGSMKHDD